MSSRNSFIVSIYFTIPSFSYVVLWNKRNNSNSSAYIIDSVKKSFDIFLFLLFHKERKYR